MEKDGLFLLNGLTEEQKKQCWQSEGIRECVYSKGEIIYDRVHIQRALALVLEGKAQVMHGRVVMNTLGVGDVFGAAALFGDEDAYDSTVLAAQSCRVLLIPQQTVARWMRDEPLVAENYIRFLSGRIRFLNRRLSTLTAGQTDDRLWRYFLAHRGADGRVVLPDGMAGLAKSLGMGRSSLYRSLDALLADGRIERKGNSFTVNQQEEDA